MTPTVKSRARANINCTQRSRDIAYSDCVTVCIATTVQYMYSTLINNCRETFTIKNHSTVQCTVCTAFSSFSHTLW